MANRPGLMRAFKNKNTEPPPRASMVRTQRVPSDLHVQHHAAEVELLVESGGKVMGILDRGARSGS